MKLEDLLEQKQKKNIRNKDYEKGYSDGYRDAKKDIIDGVEIIDGICLPVLLKKIGYKK